MATPDIVSIISGLNPTVAEIQSLFAGFAKIPSPILKVIIQLLDPAMMSKLAIWAETYVQHVNTTNTPVDTANPNNPNISGDFMDVMNGTTYVGQKLTPNDLETATNLMTQAIKENNWKSAIWIGISVSRLVAMV